MLRRSGTGLTGERCFLWSDGILWQEFPHNENAEKEGSGNITMALAKRGMWTGCLNEKKNVMNIENLKHCHFYSNEYVSSPSTVSITTYQFPDNSSACSTACSGGQHRKRHWSFSRGIHQSPLNSHKRPMLPNCIHTMTLSCFDPLW